MKALVIAALLVAALALLLFLRNSEAQTPGVTILWTAPTGTTPGSLYQMRYSRNAIGADTLAWWNAANVVGSLPSPGAAGATDSVYVPLGSWAMTYYFVARACNPPLCAPWSNVVAFTSPAGPPGRIFDMRAR